MVIKLLDDVKIRNVVCHTGDVLELQHNDTLTVLNDHYSMLVYGGRRYDLLNNSYTVIDK